MGCDIHFHIELKDGNEIWHHYAAPDIDRRYGMFGLLAGVRCHDMRPIKDTDDKLPEDVTLVTKEDYRRLGDCTHSLRVFKMKHIQELYNRQDELRFYFESKHYDIDVDFLKTFLFGNSFNNFTLKETVFTDIRFIFWFDN